MKKRIARTIVLAALLAAAPAFAGVTVSAGTVSQALTPAAAGSLFARVAGWAAALVFLL